MTTRRTRFLVPLVAAAVLGGGQLAWAATAEPAVVVREPLAAAQQVRGVEGRDLGLSRITVMPGAELAPHHHPGTQVAFVEQGTLTYSVISGSVRVLKGSSDDPTFVRRIEAGESGRIRSGQWIVEQPNDHHQAANRGEIPVVIFTATLLRTGAPAAIPD